MKIDIKKFDVKKLLPVLGGTVTVIGMILSNAIDKNNRESMKTELKDEILKELQTK